MTRVSLKEAYDNKDVVAQIYAIRDTAESAVDTSEQAVTTANTASEHVDALVPQVEGAVQNANSASASAQASAQTVAGYENRLGAVEGDVVQLNTDVDGVESDLSAVTLRVQTAEGQIVTIQGRVTALETADGQNVKIDRINDYAVGLTGNQGPITGIKSFRDTIVGVTSLGYSDNSEPISLGSYKSLFRISKSSLSAFRGVLCIASWERATGKNPELIQIGMHGNTANSILRYTIGGNATCDYFVSADNDYVYIGIKSRISNIVDNAKQMIVLTAIGLNTMTPVTAYNGPIASTPDGSLIAETS